MSDIFKELPLRLLGFGFAVGQAARYRYSERKYYICHNVGVAFVLCHVGHTIVTQPAIGPIVGTVLFEGICSCLIPPFVNYHLCGIVAELIWDLNGIPGVVKRWGPFVVGLLTIPVFLTFVDPPVDAFINENIVSAFV